MKGYGVCCGKIASLARALPGRSCVRTRCGLGQVALRVDGSSRGDEMRIARHFNAGNRVHQIYKSRRDGRERGSRPQGPFVPDGTLGIYGSRVPAMNGWAIFNGVRNGARPKCRRGNRTPGSPCEIRLRQWEALTQDIISRGEVNVAWR